MKKLILVCGPAGIGKSTYCNRYIDGHSYENVFIVSADDIRNKICGGYDKFPPNKNMMPIYNEMIKVIKDLYNKNISLTILVDTTMLNDERRLFFINNLPKFDYTSCILMKLHDYSKCLRRNSTRPADRFVPEDIILNMIKHYKDPAEESKKYFDYIEEYYSD